MAKDNGAATEVKILAEDQFLTWDDMTQIHTKRVFAPRWGKYVEYRDAIPLDEMARIQAKFPGKSKEAILGRFIEILKFVMVMPPLTEETARAAQRGNTALLTEIINDVMSEKDADEIRQSLGND